MPGSRRAPNRLLVRRTPFPTTPTLPSRRVSRVTIRSASPSLWVRRTMPSSRYNGMTSLSPTGSRRTWRRAGAPWDSVRTGPSGHPHGRLAGQVAGQLTDETSEHSTRSREELREFGLHFTELAQALSLTHEAGAPLDPVRVVRFAATAIPHTQSCSLTLVRGSSRPQTVAAT